MTASPSPSLFVGRRSELEVLDGLLAAASAGRPQVAVVRGAAGSGKTRLVERLLELHGIQAGGGPDVLRASGSAWEQELDGGVLEQLLPAGRPAPAGEPWDLATAGPALLEALTSVSLASSSPHSSTDRPAGQGQEIDPGEEPPPAGGPAVLLVDNLQWVDEATLQALLFALRRLTDQRLLAVLVLGDEHAHRLPTPCRDFLEDHRTTVVELRPLSAADILELAVRGLGVDLTEPAAHRIARYCGGNPRHVRHLLQENPPELWRQWQRELPAPRELVHDAGVRLGRLGSPARHLVEAAAVLGTTSGLADAAALAGCGDPLPALAEAGEAGLLAVAGDGGRVAVAFPSAVERAAVYHALCLPRRVALHRAAAERLADRGASLGHRAAASLLPDPQLAAELQDYAAAQAEAGAWSIAADALVTAGRLLPGGQEHEALLLRAVDAMVGAGELPRALAYADELAHFAPSPLRNAVSGYIAIVQGRQLDAATQLEQAWTLAERGRDRGALTLVAQRRVLDSLARWNGPDLVDWAECAGALAEPGSPAVIESSAIKGLGLAAMGRTAEAESSYAALVDRPDLGAQSQRVRMGMGWLHLALDRPELAREELASAVSTDFSSGSYRISLWASAWLARTEFTLGDWSQALHTIDRALVLQRSTGMELVRPLLHWTAAQIHVLRGNRDAAAEHLEQGRANSGNYPIMLLPYHLAQAQVAEARTDYEGVLRALEPVAALDRRHGLDEPGFWPWHDVYANALVMTDRIEEAEVFVAGLEPIVAERRHRSAAARLAYVRGRILGARGDINGAKDAFEAGLASLRGLNLPYERARVDFAYGQTLRRAGKRRESSIPLSRAREGFAALGASTYTERCDRELQAAGVSAARREATDWSSLTAQEQAVVRLVAGGVTNKEAAQELFVSVKTVQYHLTRTYAKLGVSSRTELAARYRAEGAQIRENQQDESR
ncbi:LuxR family transcriptional regulator [Arthrobacter ginkgonis]|uniref:LuxR family transcriptional regulator n=1 Tax=Arthrobacter ginkgonis TaxID=1630594 RepID=A0ABP7D1X6_9MICC